VTRTVSVLLLLAAVGVVLTLMWLGWRRRGRKHDVPPLPPVGSGADVRLTADGRYFGSTVSGQWLDRVVARGLGTRSTAELVLHHRGVDVVRPTGSFCIPVAALRGARHEQGIAGKVVPPDGILVVTWQHGDLLLDSGFRLSRSAAHDDWITALDTLAKEHQA